MRRVILFLFLFFCLIGSVQATDHYAAPSATGDGLTVDTPGDASTIAASLSSGDTLYFLPGTYPNEQMRWTTTPNNITLKKYNGTVILDGVDKSTVAIQASNCIGLTVDGLIIKNHLYGIDFDRNATDCVLKNLTFDTVTRAAYFSIGSAYYTENLTFSNFEILNCSENGIYVPTLVGTVNNSTISDFYIHDGTGTAATGMKLASLNNVVIKDGRTYKATVDGTAYNGITIGSNSNNILIQNITAVNESWHGIEAYGADGKNVTNITIRDCIVQNCKHGNIEIHQYTTQAKIINNTLSGLGFTYPGAVTTNAYVYDMYIENNTADGFLRAYQYYSYGNVVINNCTSKNIRGYPLHFGSQNMTATNCKFYNNNSSATVAVYLDTDAEQCMLNNCIIEDGKEIKNVRGNGTVRDLKNNYYTVSITSPSTTTIEYTNGRVFSSSVGTPIYTNTASSLVASSTQSIVAENYSAKPTTETATVTPNTPIGSELVNFTANSTNGNKVDFSVWDLTQNSYYDVKEDGVVISTVQANATGYISFNNSKWSEHTYAVEPTGELPPVAEFTSNVTSGTAPFEIQFTDSSFNTPTSWLWDFGDGNTSTDQNPVHKYWTAGTYSVNLTATNAVGSDSELKTNYIVVSTPPVVSTLWNNFWIWWGSWRWQISYWLEAV